MGRVFSVNMFYSSANVGVSVGDVRASYFEKNARASSANFQPRIHSACSTWRSCAAASSCRCPPATVADTNTSGGEPDVQSTDASGGVARSPSRPPHIGARRERASSPAATSAYPACWSSRVARRSPRPRWTAALRRGRMLSEARVGTCHRSTVWSSWAGCAGPRAGRDRSRRPSHEASQVASFTVGSLRVSGLPRLTDHQSRCSRRSTRPTRSWPRSASTSGSPPSRPRSARPAVDPFTVAVGGDTAGLESVLYPSSLAARTPRS